MPSCGGNRVLRRRGQLVGRVDLGNDIDRFDGRPFETENFRPIRLIADALRLQTAGNRVGVVLQDDEAARDTRIRVQHDDAALHHARRDRRRHEPYPPDPRILRPQRPRRGAAGAFGVA